MPVMKGGVGENSVDVLRDTACSGIVVKKDLVSEDQFTGKVNSFIRSASWISFSISSSSTCVRISSSKTLRVPNLACRDSLC